MGGGGRYSNVPAISDQEHKGDDGSASPFQKMGGGRGATELFVGVSLNRDKKGYYL